MDKIKKTICQNCSSKNTRKFGIQKNKLQTHQKYFCNDCQKTFILNKQEKNKSYPLPIILKAVTLYNLGHSQSQVQKLIKLTPKPSQKTISNWINELKTTAAYSRLRTKTQTQNPDEIIQQHTFMHNNLPYKYQIHVKKLDLLTKDNEKYQNLKHYLEKIPTNQFPHHIFTPNHSNVKQKLDRSSQTKFQVLNIKPLKKQNLANKLCTLALNLARTSKQRHEKVQKFMLINDSVTIAVEIPIYLTHDDLLYFKDHNFSLNPNDFSTPITGHIDLIQIRNNLIHVLDYKPEASKINPIHQLTIYALALASKTKLPLTMFKCAWFDENNYYEFFPLHVVKKKSIY